MTTTVPATVAAAVRKIPAATATTPVPNSAAAATGRSAVPARRGASPAIFRSSATAPPISSPWTMWSPSTPTRTTPPSSTATTSCFVPWRSATSRSRLDKERFVRIHRSHIRQYRAGGRLQTLRRQRNGRDGRRTGLCGAGQQEPDRLAQIAGRGADRRRSRCRTAPPPSFCSAVNVSAVEIITSGILTQFVQSAPPLVQKPDVSCAIAMRRCSGACCCERTQRDHRCPKDAIGIGAQTAVVTTSAAKKRKGGCP